MRRRWTGGSIQKVKLAKRDKALKQQDYFDKKKGGIEYNKTRKVNEAVFQNFSASPDLNLDKTEAYLSKDYLLLSSRTSSKTKPTKVEEVVEQPVEEQTHIVPVQVPTTIAMETGIAPRADKVLFIDEGRDRTEEVHAALRCEGLFVHNLGDNNRVGHQSTPELYPDIADKLLYNKLLDATLLMREQ